MVKFPHTMLPWMDEQCYSMSFQLRSQFSKDRQLGRALKVLQSEVDSSVSFGGSMELMALPTTCPPLKHLCFNVSEVKFSLNYTYINLQCNYVEYNLMTSATAVCRQATSLSCHQHYIRDVF